MAEEFCRAVDDGMKLSKRIYFGKDRAVAPPKVPTMSKSLTSLLPKAPMVYAVIHDPGIVDNPDIASYQPHVYGRCDPPALIPLQMNAIEMEIDCYLDTAFVTVSGTWRVHCVTGSSTTDCRLAIPIGDEVLLFFFAAFSVCLSPFEVSAFLNFFIHSTTTVIYWILI